jgi:hypothetical protein
MTKKTTPLKADKKSIKSQVERHVDLEAEEAPLLVEKLYSDFLKKGTVDKETYDQVKRLHKEYITPDIKLAYKYGSVPKSVKDEYDAKLKVLRDKLISGVIYPAEGNDEYLKNPEKYKDFDDAKKKLNTQSKALFNKHFKKHNIKIDKKGTVMLIK